MTGATADGSATNFGAQDQAATGIVALSSRPSNLRGKQGNIVIDEAAFHDNLPALLKAALAIMMWGGRIRVISTHNGADNPFADLVSTTLLKSVNL